MKNANILFTTALFVFMANAAKSQSTQQNYQISDSLLSCWNKLGVNDRLPILNHNKNVNFDSVKYQIRNLTFDSAFYSKQIMKIIKEIRNLEEEKIKYISYNTDFNTMISEADSVRRKTVKESLLKKLDKEKQNTQSVIDEYIKPLIANNKTEIDIKLASYKLLHDKFSEIFEKLYRNRNIINYYNSQKQN